MVKLQTHKLNLATLGFIILVMITTMMMPNEARSGEIYKIDQITDVMADDPEKFYKFAPNYLWVKPGDTLRFMNSYGTHTVKSVDGIWPKDVAKVSIAYKPFYDVVLDTPGVYGFKCRVHGRHGMFALVVVGDVKPDLNQWKNADLSDIGEKVFSTLYQSLEKDLSKRQ